MPVDWSRYPANWREVRTRIVERAGDCCEWCGAPNRQIIVRDDPRDPSAWRPAEFGEILEDDGTPTTLVVLTVAHLGAPHPDGTPGDKHDKHDVRDENLAALCQRCHLLYDLDDHIRNAAVTRRRQRIADGQTTFMPEEVR